MLNSVSCIIKQYSKLSLVINYSIYFVYKNLKNIQMETQFDYEAELKKLEEKIIDAQTNFGDIQVRDAILAKADFIKKNNGDKTIAIPVYEEALKKTIQIGKKMDINFEILSIHLSQRNLIKVKEVIDICKDLFEKGGDWERKNKLKIYEALYLLLIRDFKEASILFVDAIPTFNSTDIMSYETLIYYAILTGLPFMTRQDIKKKLLDSSEVTVHLTNPQLKQMLHTFYSADYNGFFKAFIWALQSVQSNEYLHQHYRYFMRQTRVTIYSQFLQSYKTVKLETMAKTFGVSAQFMDRELSELIAARRLHCKIDKVDGVIMTERTDERNKLYKQVLKKGDHLLNRIQKLSRVVDV